MTADEHGKAGRGGELRSAIAELCRELGLSELYVFGSRTAAIAARVRGEEPPSGADSPASDVDVGVRPLPGRHLDVHALVGVADRLETLLGAPRVDVVLLPTASPFLALDVIRGELLFCADHDAQAEFELYVLRRAGDLAPFQRQRQELALSRYEDR